MTSLKRLTIESLGCNKESLDELDPHINAIVGDNGAGKSALSEGLLFALYGLNKVPDARSNGESRDNPTFYDNIHQHRCVRAVLQEPTGTLFEVVSESTGRQATEPVVAPENRALFDAYLGGVSRDEFKTLWHVAARDINSIQSRSTQTVGRLAAADFNIPQEPPKVLKNLENTLNEFEKGGASGILRNALKEITQTESTCNDLETQSRELFADVSRQAELATEVRGVRRTKDELVEKQRTLISDATNVQTARDNMVRLSEEHEQNSARVTLARQAYEALKQEQDQLVLGLSAQIEDVCNKRGLLDNYMHQRDEAELALDKNRAEAQQLGELIAPLDSFQIDELIREADTLRLQEETAQNEYEKLRLELQELDKQGAAESAEQQGNTGGMGRALGWAGVIIGLLALIATLVIDSPLRMVIGVAGALVAIAGVFALTWKTQKESATPIVEQHSVITRVQFEAAQKRLENAREAWQAFIGRVFAEKAASIQGAQDTHLALKKIKRRLEIEQEYGVAKEKSTTASLQIDAIEKQITAIGQACGLPDTAGSGSRLLQALADRLSLAEVQSKRLDQQANELRQAQLADRESLGRIERAQKTLQEIAERYQVRPDAAEAELQTQELEIEKELERLNAQLDEALAEQGRLEERLKNAAGSEEMDAARAKNAAAHQNLDDLVDDYLVILIAQTLLARTIETYAHDPRAQLEKLTSELFVTMTNGAFERVSLERDHFGAYDHNGAFWEPVRMSEATLHQFYIALRLGILESRPEYGPSLPLVLDDAFESFDPQRRAAAFKALSKVAENRQVFYLAHESSPELESWAAEGKKFTLGV